MGGDTMSDKRTGQAQPRHKVGRTQPKTTTQTTTDEEIATYLDGLNRVQDAAEVTPYSAQAKAKGIDNYLQWFKAHHIAIHKDTRTNVWKLGPP